MHTQMKKQSAAHNQSVQHGNAWKSHFAAIKETAIDETAINETAINETVGSEEDVEAAKGVCVCVCAVSGADPCQASSRCHHHHQQTS